MKQLLKLVPVTCLVAFIASAVVSIALAHANAAPGRASIPLLVATGIFALVGAIVVTRRPDNLIGWLFLVIALFWSLGTLGIEYSIYGAVTEPGSVPAPWIGAWFGEWNWLVFWYSTLVVTPILFPIGRALSRRWHLALMVILGIASLMVILAMFDRHLELEGTGRSLKSPIGTGFGADPDDEGSVTSYLLPSMFVSAAIGLAALVVRFRRSRGEERLQMKWLTFGSIVAMASFVGGIVWDAATGDNAPEITFAIGVAAIPLGAGVGILRYRLYDIDVIINRTLVYAGLTAILAGCYLVMVFGLQQILPLSTDSDIAVAASTLAVAALFRPLRSRVQSFIDRRFYRSRYDASRTLAAFNERLRNEVDVDQVRTEALDVVATTVQPSQAWIWLREAS